MTSDLDIYRSANVLIREYGDDAALEAAQRADAMLKAIRRGNPSVDAKRYLDIRFRGEKQRIVGKSADIDRDLIFVLVRIGKMSGEDRFFVYQQGFLQDLIYEKHRAFLRRYGGVRPKNPSSTHCAYSIQDLTEAEAEGAWSLILDKLV